MAKYLDSGSVPNRFYIGINSKN